MKTKLLVMVLIGLAGCSSTNNSVSNDDNDWYLRADFTYWQANKEFAFRYNNEQSVYYLTTEVKYDGQPYQFVIADRVWSANKNCGYTEPKSRKVTYNNWIAVNCNYSVEDNPVTPIQKPFEFLPKGSGKYLFELKVNQLGTPTHVRLSAVKKQIKSPSR